MISRVWCKILALSLVGADEVWTDFSKPQVPARWKSSTPGQLGRALQSLAEPYPIVLEVARQSEAAGVNFWAAARIEHQGCEIRKCSEGNSKAYKPAAMAKANGKSKAKAKSKAV